MRIPSLSNLLREARRTYERFPLTLISAVVGVVGLLLLTQSGGRYDRDFLWRLVLPASLGLPLFTVSEIFCDKHGLSTGSRWIIRAAGTVVLMLYALGLPSNLETAPFEHHIRYVLLAIGLHFLVSFLPFAGKGQVNGFWQYNKVLFLRFLTAALYSAVLYIGLVIALVAIKELFGLRMQGNRFLQLFIVIAGIFNTWFFLAGLPEEPDRLNQESGYPKGLKVFTQYILLPLVVVYLGILYAYEIKIILAWSWPKGWVSHLVLWFSVVGILALLLVHPVRELAENRWVNVFSRWLFVALVPLVTMLLLSIFRRIADYGITENRYFVLLQAWALAMVVVYFIFSKKKDIRIIPQILCFLAFFSSFGPWSAFSLSQSSQTRRLAGLLTRNDILVDGRVQNTGHEISSEDRWEISNLVNYLTRTHGVESLGMWFEDDLSKVSDSRWYSARDTVLHRMGLEYMPGWVGLDVDVNFFHLSSEKSSPALVDVSQYDYYIESNLSNTTTQPLVLAGGDSIQLALLPNSATFRIMQSGARRDTLDLDLADFLKRTASLYNNRLIPADKLVFEGSDGRLAAKLLIDFVEGERADGVKIRQIGSRLLLSVGSEGTK